MNHLAPASDVGLGHLSLGCSLPLTTTGFRDLFKHFLAISDFFQTKTRSLNPTELTRWVITKVEQSQKAENTHTVHWWDTKVCLHKDRIILGLTPTS